MIVSTGLGTYTFASGNEYVGAFLDDTFSGEGAYGFADGAKYVGQYESGVANGQGVYTYTDGGEYRGAFIDGVQTGQGVRTGAQKQNWRVTTTSGNLDAIKWRGMELTAMLTAPHTSVTSRMV